MRQPGYGDARECGSCRRADVSEPATRHDQRAEERRGGARLVPVAAGELCQVRACERERGNRRYCRAHYEREINKVMVVDGDILDLAQSFDHHPFSKGLDHWIAKHNVYSRMEAQVIASGQRGQPSWREAFFNPDFNERRVHQKGLFYAMPGRPFIKFAYMVLARRAFLDGWAGIRYALLQSIYEYFIVLKTKEIREIQGPGS